MKTYLALLGLLLCTSLHCMSQNTWDYSSSRKWIDEWVGRTNQTPETERIFVASHSPEFAFIVPYRKGITLREIIDQTRLNNATLAVGVMRPNNQGKLIQKMTPQDTSDFEIKKGDVIWLIDISPPFQI